MKTAGLCIALIALAVLSGCVVTQEVYVQDATVSGPINSPPVNVVLDSAVNQVRLSPQFAFSSEKHLSGTIKDDIGLNGGRPYPLAWNLPDFAFGLGLDWSVSKSFSLDAGAQYSALGPTAIWGGYLGLGLKSLGPNVGFRFDLGVMLNGFNHDAYSVVVTHVDYLFGSSSDTAFYHDRGKDLAMDFYAGLTLNSNINNSPVNVFLNGSVFRQTLMSYTPGTSSERHPFVTYASSTGDAEYRATVFSVTPGVSVDISDRVRLLAGWRFVLLTEADLSRESVGNPFIQLDFTP